MQAGGLRQFQRGPESLLGLRDHESGAHGGGGREGGRGHSRRAEGNSRSTPRNCEKAKNQEISGFILGRDTDEEKAVALASAAVIGKDPGLVNTELDRYLKVTPADIQRVAKEYFVPQHATVLTVTPAAHRLR